MGLCFNRFWDTVLPPSKLPFGTRGAHFAHLLRVPFWLILWNRFLMVLAPNMLPKVSAGSGSETAWGPRGSPRHPRSPFGLPLGSLWPPFGLPKVPFGLPFRSFDLPLVPFWSRSRNIFRLISGILPLFVFPTNQATCGLCRRHIDIY